MDIKELRETLGLTYEEFGVKLGVSGRTVYRWETGENKPSRLALRQLRRLEKKLDSKARSKIS